MDLGPLAVILLFLLAAAKLIRDVPCFKIPPSALSATVSNNGRRQREHEPYDGCKANGDQERIGHQPAGDL